MTTFAAIGEDLFTAILQGTPPGTVYALVAIGFVLTYKTSGVFNLAFGAQAYISAVVYFQLHTEQEWPILPSFVIAVVLLAPAVGLVLERLIFRNLRTASSVAKLVVTIGLSVALPALIDLAIGFESVAGVTPEGIVPDGSTVFYDPFGVYAFSRNELVAMAVAAVAILGLGALFRFSGIGLQMRAVVESPRMTELNGIAADRVSAFAWALSSFFAGLAGVLIAPRFNTLAALDFFNIVVIAVAAAAVGKLVSLPRALAGGLGLGILIALINTFLPKWSDDLTWLRPIQENLTPAIPFVVLFCVLIFVPGIRKDREAGDPLSGVDPPTRGGAVAAPDPRRVLIRRIASTVALVAILAVVFTQADVSWMFLVTQAVVLGIIFLSFTVITGMSGQISLAQGTFAAIGAFTVFQMVDRYDLSVLAAAAIGAVIAAGVAALVSLPIRRLNGIWVAIATLAFAYFFDAVLVKMSWVGGGDTALLQGTDVPRPTLLGIDFGNDKAFLALALVVLAIVAVGVIQIRGGTTGRTFRAMDGSEVAAQSIGISPARIHTMAFAIAGFIAGLGGAMLAMHEGDVNYDTNYAPFAALFGLVIVVTLGVRTVEGAVTAAAVFSLFDAVVLQGAIFEWVLRSPELVPDIFPISPRWQYVLFGLGTIQFARHPEGILEYRKRRAALKHARRAEQAAAQHPPPGAGTEAGVVPEPVE